MQLPVTVLNFKFLTWHVVIVSITEWKCKKQAKIENRKSKNEKRKMKIEKRKTKIENRTTKIEHRKRKLKIENENPKHKIWLDLYITNQGLSAVCSSCPLSQLTLSDNVSLPIFFSSVLFLLFWFFFFFFKLK